MMNVYRRRLTAICFGVFSFLATVSSLSVRHQSSLGAVRRPTDAPSLQIRYSPSFQRHVVYSGEKVVASYDFLDDARSAYPTATLTEQVCIAVAGGGVAEATAYATGEPALVVDDDLVESVCEALEDTVSRILSSVPRERWHGLSLETIRSHTQQLDSLLQAKLHVPQGSAALVVNSFPHVLLYDPKHIEERLDFLTAPLPSSHEEDTDWPLLASKGYGAGWSIPQVRQALQAVPHVVLAMYLEDAAAMKPSLLYFLSVLQVSYADVDQARAQLDSWIGGDVYSFTYLHQLGIEWDQLSATLQAFPSLAVCDTEPTWEMVGDVRSVLKEDALHYLQRRLQIRPSTVQAMIKTHARLSTYSVEGKIQPTLNALQSKIGLSSSELRKIVTRMPSLVGMSVDESCERGLMQRLKFFYHEVGMSQLELRKAVLGQPSLLQYSVDNSLRPKLDFLVEDLCIPLTEMPRVIAKQPSLMGFSLDDTLRPNANTLMRSCGFLPEELGDILVRAPSVLTLSWKRKIEPTLEYLRDRLVLSQPQLKGLVFSTPRVLSQGIKTSLESKLQMVQDALDSEGSEQIAATVVKANPALLVTSNAVLQQRIQAGSSTTKALQSRFKDAVRRTRPVLEMDAFSNEVVREYPSAKAAATELGTSTPNMYNICNTGRLWKGKKYEYGLSEEPLIPTPSQKPPPISNKPRRKKRTDMGPLVFRCLRSSLRASDYPVEPSRADDTVRIIVYASGRVYPPDSMDQVRGTRRAGGIVLYFPQIDEYHHGPELSTRLRRAAENSFSQIMPVEENGSYYNDGRILAGFPYLRPSRNRCELYACHDALKVVNQLLKHEATLGSLKEDTVQIDIYTDSDYAWKLLHNTTRLHEWGDSAKLVYNGPGPASRANPDLLHPLCRTYYRLVQQQDTDGQKLDFGKQVNVSFHHAAGTMASLHGYAKNAAVWMDQRAKAAVKS